MLEPDLLSRPLSRGKKGIHVLYEFHVLDGGPFGSGEVTAAPARKPVGETYKLDEEWYDNTENNIHFIAYCESDLMARGTEVIGVVSSARIIA
jgi:hypothetical protein